MLILFVFVIFFVLEWNAIHGTGPLKMKPVIDVAETAVLISDGDDEIDKPMKDKRRERGLNRSLSMRMHYSDFEHVSDIALSEHVNRMSEYGEFKGKHVFLFGSLFLIVSMMIVCILVDPVNNN